MLHKELTEEILYWFYQVYNELGYGFLEKVYKNALFFDMTDAGLVYDVELPINVHYKNRIIGSYYADIVVDKKVILELKTAETISKEHEYQLINYLKATEYEVGLLLNFGKQPEFKRVIFTNDKKKRDNQR